MIPVYDLLPVRSFRVQLENRFPLTGRRAPTEADFAALRHLLSAIGGDVEELARWAGAVRDTDDDSAALTAYWARLEYGVLKTVDQIKIRIAEINKQNYRRELGKYLSEYMAKKKRGPRKDKYINVDQDIVRYAETITHLLPRGTPVKAIIARAVRDNWSPALGQSEGAATARIFARLRRRRVKTKDVIGSLPPDITSSLTERIAPRKRGVRKFGRPRRVSNTN
jgi:hypothetical protein